MIDNNNNLIYLSGQSLSCCMTSPRVVRELLILQPSLNLSIDARV